MKNNFYENAAATGTTAYHRISQFVPLVATDGVAQMFLELKSFWIGDVVASYLAKINRSGDFFQVTVVRGKSGGARFAVEDGNGGKVLAQRIQYTDLLQDVKMFLAPIPYEGHKRGWVLMLPSEY